MMRKTYTEVLPEQERKKGVPWTEEEHKLFLLGLKKYSRGDWRNISRNFVQTRTPTQVARHAQKYFIKLNSVGKDKRSSIHDITTVNLTVDQPPLPSQSSLITNQSNPSQYDYPPHQVQMPDPKFGAPYYHLPQPQQSIGIMDAYARKNAEDMDTIRTSSNRIDDGNAGIAYELGRLGLGEPDQYQGGRYQQYYEQGFNTRNDDNEE